MARRLGSEGGHVSAAPTVREIIGEVRHAIERDGDDVDVKGLQRDIEYAAELSAGDGNRALRLREISEELTGMDPSMVRLKVFEELKKIA